MKLFQITFTNLEWQPPSAFTRLHHTVKNHFCLREPMSRHGSLGGSTCKHSSGHRRAGAPAARAQARPGRPGQPPAAPGAGSSRSQSQSQPSGAPRTAPPGRPARPCGRACEGRRGVPSVTFPEEVAALPPQELVPEGAGGVLVRQRHLRQPQRGLLGGQRGARPRPPHGHGAPRVPLAQLRPRPGHQQLRAALRHPGGQHHAEAEQHFTAAQRTGFIEELCYRSGTARSRAAAGRPPRPALPPRLRGRTLALPLPPPLPRTLALPLSRALSRTPPLSRTPALSWTLPRAPALPLRVPSGGSVGRGCSRCGCSQRSAASRT